MDAKAMKKISQAYNATQMGKIWQVVVNAAVAGSNYVVLDTAPDAGLSKYLTDLGYKIEDKEEKVTISW